VMRGAPVASESFERHRAAVRARLDGSDHVRAGPDSISWQVNRELVAVAGWGRAILMQLAHPSVSAGVHDHTTFRGSLWSGFRRLHSTIGAMLAITFGDTEQMIAAAAGINAIHDRVRGRVAGSPQDTYSAHDPELQRWVHATLLQSIPMTYDLLVRPLTPGERDRYCAETTIMEPLLGMPRGWLPRTSAELDGYIEEMLTSGRLVVTDSSRALARAVLYPPQWQLAWPAFRAMALLSIGTLPPSLRDAYGFPWRERDARAVKRWTWLLRTSLRLLPSFARHWPVARRAARTWRHHGIGSDLHAQLVAPSR
jgi:uncharacterized protein (DUF2236 family)